MDSILSRKGILLIFLYFILMSLSLSGALRESYPHLNKYSQNTQELRQPILKSLNKHHIEELSPTASDGQDAVQSLGRDLSQLALLQGDLQKEELRKQKLTELAQDPHVLELSQKIITNLKWTLETYPQDQAKIRVFAIQLLKMGALQGDLLRLEETARSLSRHLRLAEKWEKGEEHDLTDLLIAWISFQTREELISNPETLFKKFLYSPRLKMVFARAIEFELKRNTFDPLLDEAFLPYWDTNFSAENTSEVN